MKKHSDLILEAGLSRLRLHLASGGIGIVSSATGESDSPDSQKKLIRRARELGYGPIVARGKTRDWGSESSVIIPRVSLGHLKQLGDEFGQQAVIHAPSPGRATLHYLSAAGERAGTSEEIGAAQFNKPNDLGITVLKGAGYHPRDASEPARSITFEGLELQYPPRGHLNPLWVDVGVGELWADETS